jgi:5S rRNA maturation endonuclease (ribonuclease M5)
VCIQKTRIDQVKFALRKLKDLNQQGVPVIVEGIRDERALNSLGITSHILKLRGRLPDFVGSIHSDTAVILTDCDRRGNILAGRLAALLKNEGIQPNLEIRAMLRAYAGMRFVEELPSLLLELKIKNKEGDVHGEIIY